MFTKKFVQLFLFLALVATSFMTASSAQAASACGTSYSITNGETLRKIAIKCGTTLSALQRANPEIGSGDLIYPGQVLQLPGAMLYGDGSKAYVIARGETLKSLAARFGTTVDDLLSLNPSITNVNLIYEGQRLVYQMNGGIPNPIPGGQTYTIQRGDTLKKIAAWSGSTLEALLQVNPQISNANLIYVGQVINLPVAVTNYTVQRGDTLKKIAAKFGNTADNLIWLNSLANPNLIYPGQVLRLW